MRSLNKLQIIGNLGRDAEFSVTKGGHPVLKFSVATTEKWKGGDGAQHEKTEWHRCVYWGKGAEAVRDYLRKGTAVYVEGSIDSRKYEKDGVEKSITEVKVREVILLSAKAAPREKERNDQDEYGYESAPEQAASNGGGEVDDFDVPF